ncbi:FAD:protein FMN transferase [Aliikangiella marina]|nr:FAD:protein FMN transferase [Aliikangiella marina]
MGTTYQITLESQGIDSKKLQQQVDDRLIEINQLMSTYIADSELMRFNGNQTTDCIPLSADTQYVIESAVQIAKESNGKFDVTLGPLIEIWGFDKKDTNNQIPSQETIDNLLETIGTDKITVEQSCVAKKLANLSINLSAIAKGYGVDEIARIVEAAGSQNYLVEIGGEVITKGVNSRQKPWVIAIESATLDQRSIQKTLTPNGLGVATSGDYRNYFEKDGKRYSHTIDPTTGYPITHNLASVTVLHPQVMFADAYATAMMVMGPEASLAFANRYNLPIFMLVKSSAGFEEVYSEAFKPFLSDL